MPPPSLLPKSQTLHSQSEPTPFLCVAEPQSLPLGSWFRSGLCPPPSTQKCGDQAILLFPPSPTWPGWDWVRLPSSHGIRACPLVSLLGQVQAGPSPPSQCYWIGMGLPLQMRPLCLHHRCHIGSTSQILPTEGQATAHPVPLTKELSTTVLGDTMGTVELYSGMLYFVFLTF